MLALPSRDHVEGVQDMEERHCILLPGISLEDNGKIEREKGDKKKGEIEEAELRALIEQSMCGRLLLLVVLHGIMVDNIPRVERCKRTYCYGLRLQF